MSCVLLSKSGQACFEFINVSFDVLCSFGKRACDAQIDLNEKSNAKKILTNQNLQAGRVQKKTRSPPFMKCRTRTTKTLAPLEKLINGQPM